MNTSVVLVKPAIIYFTTGLDINGRRQPTSGLALDY